MYPITEYDLNRITNEQRYLAALRVQAELKAIFHATVERISAQTGDFTFLGQVFGDAEFSLVKHLNRHTR